MFSDTTRRDNVYVIRVMDQPLSYRSPFAISRKPNFVNRSKFSPAGLLQMGLLVVVGWLGFSLPLGLGAVEGSVNSTSGALVENRSYRANAKTPFGAEVSGTSVTSVASAYCPFCAAINATFGEQIDKHDLVVIAKLIEQPPEAQEDDWEFPKGKFEIDQVVKGDEWVAKGMVFPTQLVGKYPLGQKFLVMGVEPPQVLWSTPVQASDKLIQYLFDSQQLPKSGPERLAFFQEYFENEESVIAFDAYDEFAIADYKDLIAMKDRIKREQIIQWINDPEIRVDRRRLYFTMLGVCGQADDIEMLEELIRSKEEDKLAGLDSLVACYLLLKKSDGLPLIEERFLKDPEIDFRDANAVLSALRFHGTEVEIIPRIRLAQSARLFLDRPELADMVIPDLARWEDWSVMEQLVEMFETASEDNQWIRVPIITYLKACPKPEAKAHIAKLAKIDPDAVRRAEFFMGGFIDDSIDDDELEKESDDKKEGDDKKESKTDIEANLDSAVTDEEQEWVSYKVASSDFDSMESIDLNDDLNDDLDDDLDDSVQQTLTASPNFSPNQTEQFAVESETTSNNDQVAAANVASGAVNAPSPTPIAVAVQPRLGLIIIGVVFAASALLFLLLWSVVNGWFERLIY